MLGNHTEINIATMPCEILSKDIKTHVVCQSYRHNYLLGKQSVMELKRQVNKWRVNDHLLAWVNDPLGCCCERREKQQTCIIILRSHCCHKVLSVGGNVRHLQKKSCLIVGINITWNENTGKVYEKSKTGQLSAEFF